MTCIHNDRKKKQISPPASVTKCIVQYDMCIWLNIYSYSVILYDFIPCHIEMPQLQKKLTYSLPFKKTKSKFCISHPNAAFTKFRFLWLLRSHMVHSGLKTKCKFHSKVCVQFAINAIFLWAEFTIIFPHYSASAMTVGCFPVVWLIWREMHLLMCSLLTWSSGALSPGGFTGLGLQPCVVGWTPVDGIESLTFLYVDSILFDTAATVRWYIFWRLLSLFCRPEVWATQRGCGPELLGYFGFNLL